MCKDTYVPHKLLLQMFITYYILTIPQIQVSSNILRSSPHYNKEFEV